MRKWEGEEGEHGGYVITDYEKHFMFLRAFHVCTLYVRRVLRAILTYAYMYIIHMRFTIRGCHVNINSGLPSRNPEFFFVNASLTIVERSRARGNAYINSYIYIRGAEPSTLRSRNPPRAFSIDFPVHHVGSDRSLVSISQIPVRQIAGGEKQASERASEARTRE